MSKRILSPVVAFWLSVLSGLCFAQTVSPTSAEGGGCGSLPGAAENVKAFASALNICPDVARVMQRLSTQSLSTAERAPARRETSPEPLNLLSPDVLQAQREGIRGAQEQEDRQHINEAITRAALDSNLVLLKIQNTLLQYQMSVLVDEKRAYKRTKILNALLGTSVGAVGTGLQLSSSARVQQAGDIVGVVGGAITAVFAWCTAEIDPSAFAGTNLFSAFTDGNKDQVIPDDAWNYLKNDAVLTSVMRSAAKAPPPQNKLLSCHFKAAPQSQGQLALRQRALSALEDRLGMMNQAGADLLRSISPH
jgi:hypothetical protein